MALLDFLFSGSAPVQQPTGSDSSTNFPLWLQQGTYNLANSAMNQANEPFTPFQGPQVAGPSAQTQQAWQTAGQNVGNYQPALNAATNLTNQATTPVTSQDIGAFFNPYSQGVLSTMENQANQNLFENILPGVNQSFISAGQFGSPQNADLTSRAIRDTQQATLNAAAPYISQGYTGAANQALQQKQQLQTGGAQLGNIGALTQQLGTGDVGSLAAAGQGQDTLAQANINAALSNYQQQQAWPYQNIGFASNVLHGLPVGTTTQTAGLQTPSAYNPSPLSTFAGTALAGKAIGLARGGHFRHGGALNIHRRAA